MDEKLTRKDMMYKINKRRTGLWLVKNGESFCLNERKSILVSYYAVIFQILNKNVVITKP